MVRFHPTHGTPSCYGDPDYNRPGTVCGPTRTRMPPPNWTGRNHPCHGTGHSPTRSRNRPNAGHESARRRRGSHNVGHRVLSTRALTRMERPQCQPSHPPSRPLSRPAARPYRVPTTGTWHAGRSLSPSRPGVLVDRGRVARGCSRGGPTGRVASRHCRDRRGGLPHTGPTSSLPQRREARH